MFDTDFLQGISPSIQEASDKTPNDLNENNMSEQKIDNKCCTGF